jgi:hypothetical protein
MSTEEGYWFSPEERHVLPGAPFKLSHPLRRSVAYAGVGIATGIASTFGNSLISVNVVNLSGSLGLDLTEANWLLAIYYAMIATANLTLVKARVQFGIPNATFGLLAAYAVIGLLQIPFPGFLTAAMTRAICGLSAGMLIALSLFYLVQAFPGKLAALGPVIGLALPQIGTALARLVPVDVLAANGWYGLHLIEPAVALGVIVLIALVPLPPGEVGKAFEKLDFVTVALAVPAMLLICGVLAEGRLLWWTDAPVLGWMLAAAIPMLALAALLEAHRSRPLFRLGGIAGAEMLRIASVTLLVRLALAEQTYGSVGLLTFGGLNNDQLHSLFALVALAMALGAIAAALAAVAAGTPAALSRLVPWLALVAALTISAGALIDSGATSVTRAPQLFLSQALIGFGTTLFIGPGLLIGFMRVVSKGPEHFVSWIVLFSVTQNVGGLAGSALLGSYQFIQARSHAVALSRDLVASNPLVVERLQSGADAVAGTVGDSTLRAAEGAAILGQQMTVQVNVLAFNDVFRLLAIMSLLTAAYVFYLIVRNERRNQLLPEARPQT